MSKRSRSFLLGPIVILAFLFTSMGTQATVVRMTTSLGTIDVNLYDELTPITVANFLSYVDSQAYNGSYVHRSVPGFIVQGGGYTYDETDGLSAVTKGAAIANEPTYSNIRGTIAMAKLGSSENSATSEWFFNLNNNASNLDLQNGGFTVFGEVLLDDMDVVDAIAGLSIFNFGGAASALPLRDYTEADGTAGVVPNGDNYVLIESVTIVDSDIDTLGGALPTLALEAESDGESSGGGASNVWILLILTVLVGRRRMLKP